MSGFIPTSRASLMMDIVALAMLAVIPLMLWSIYQVRVRRRYDLHRRVQMWLGSILLVAVVLFEVDVRLNGWRHNAMPSPYYATWLNPVLYVHVTIAVLTTLLWVYTVLIAARRFAPPVSPNSYSHRHR